MQKPGLPQGTRDFSAEVVHKRNYILNHIRRVFELFGFQPLETPAMENLETLMGKYGEEGDKLIFKILNNGLHDPKNQEKAHLGFQKLMDGKNDAALTERALKYDLTIPFARYLAMNQGQIQFPFKRYQIQNVWRADRPQKGRYREFTQCDADVAGSRSLLNEVELAQIYHMVFTNLKLTGYQLKVNSRKILLALAEQCGGADKLTDISVAIDKLDKIGWEKVKSELESRGLDAAAIANIESYLGIQGTPTQKLSALRQLLGNRMAAEDGIAELEFLIKHCKEVQLELDFTLARGLNYYTGIIFEVKGPEQIKIGSIGGGGRYDDLTGLFGLPNISGVGISFGVDRIYDVMEALELFPRNLNFGPRALFFNMGEKESAFAFEQMQLLRYAGISCELYPEASKLDKQFKYAEKKHIAWVIIIGSEELERSIARVKNLESGQQTEVPVQELATFLQQV